MAEVSVPTGEPDNYDPVLARWHSKPWDIRGGYTSLGSSGMWTITRSDKPDPRVIVRPVGFTANLHPSVSDTPPPTNPDPMTWEGDQA